jgi:hypothetical protein
MKKNPVMNYNQFMSAFKSAENGYGKKANVSNKDAKGTSKVDQEMAKDVIKGKATGAISKYTKEHLSRVKSKNVIKGK